MNDLTWSWLGRRDYGTTWAQQQERRRAVIERTKPETVWLLEHEPTITTGRRAVRDLPSAERLKDRGIELFQTERGGLATYHGPGQLMVYAIIDCWRRGLGAKMAVRTMEGAILDWLRELNIDGQRRAGFPGIWVGTNKIAAIGMHFRSGVSMHGAAIYLTNEPSGFDLITPCGVTDGGLTTVETESGRRLPTRDAAPQFAEHLLQNFRDPECLRSCTINEA
ncbi:MAG: lipoyl(octanoyl) transferase LipB [Myxococcota bacterium]|nr:lipoyl(octanoyl) transferase LipB [Myxococcota bacterium]